LYIKQFKSEEVNSLEFLHIAHEENLTAEQTPSYQILLKLIQDWQSEPAKIKIKTNMCYQKEKKKGK